MRLMSNFWRMIIATRPLWCALRGHCSIKKEVVAMFEAMSGFWRKVIQVIVEMLLDYLEKRNKK